MPGIKKHGVILEKTKLGFENDAVFNPAVISENGNIHLYYRAVRIGNFSTIGYCSLSSPTKVDTRLSHPLIIPDFDYEKHGIEDPRIVKIEDTYYMTYTAYDGHNALGALATSKDLLTFKKHGIIVPKLSYKDFDLCIECCDSLNPKYLRFYNIFKKRAGHESTEKLMVWDKDVMFFPRKINGKFAFLHRIYPSIQIAYFDKLEDLTDNYWREYLFNLNKYIVIDSKYKYESSYIGGGCPPIETDDGWLVIYHGVEDTSDGFVYHASAALLDIDDPTRELGQLDKPLFSPQESYEKEGTVKNVVFPTGTVLDGDDLYIYYGAADSSIAVASIKLSSLLSKLKKSGIR